MTCKNILIIEDDRAIRQTLKNALELEGYVVATAQDGSEGLHLLKESPKQPCVIVLDLMMPGTNGWQFLDSQRMDPSISKIPVIVCSAYHESARSVKPYAVINKPIHIESLLKAVQSLCA